MGWSEQGPKPDDVKVLFLEKARLDGDHWLVPVIPDDPLLREVIPASRPSC